MTTHDEIDALLQRLVSPQLRARLRAAGIKVRVGIEADELPIEAIATTLTDLLDEQQQQDKQSQRLAALGTTSAGLVHEVRNMLTSVKGYAQVGLRKKDPAKISGYLERIDSETGKALESLELVLSFARNRPRHNAVFDLRDSLSRAARATRHQLELHEVTLVVDLPEAELPVYGSRVEIEQVLVNLALNAQQAMASGGHVTLRATADDSRATVQVIDDGPGIDSDTVDRVFDPFYTTKSNGTGLGLAISQRIAEEHGGELSLTSVLEKGTTFRLVVPLHREKV